MDRGAWRARVHRITKSWTGLGGFTFTKKALKGKLETLWVELWELESTCFVAIPGRVNLMRGARHKYEWITERHFYSLVE